MFSQSDKENIDPSNVYMLPQTPKRARKGNRLGKYRGHYMRTSKLPKSRLKGKIAEELSFSDETYDKFIPKKKE